MKRIIKDCFTENDGKTFCPVRMVGIGGGISLLVFFFIGWAWNVKSSGHFDAMLFATSSGLMMGTITAAISGSIAIKATTDKGSVEISKHV